MDAPLQLPCTAGTHKALAQCASAPALLPNRSRHGARCPAPMLALALMLLLARLRSHLFSRPRCVSEVRGRACAGALATRPCALTTGGCAHRCQADRGVQANARSR
eukprot:5217744-Alexandrium_andersonii.AAC.1